MEEQESKFTKFVPDPEVRRRKLLPWWIRFFSWFYMIAGATCIIAIILMLAGIQPYLGIYGLNASNLWDISTFIIIITYLWNGITAYALWFEKKYAVTLAIVNSIWGILICIYSMVAAQGITNFRLELIILIIFIIKLFSIKYRWENTPAFY